MIVKDLSNSFNPVPKPKDKNNNKKKRTNKKENVKISKIGT